MRILYIPRGRYELPTNWRRIWPWQRKPIAGQDGFFLASLLSAFPETTQMPMAELVEGQMDLDREFDWVVVNYKGDPACKGLRPEHLSWLDRLKKVRKALLITYDAAAVLPRDELLDRFDLIFKRELLHDLNRYGVSARQHAKLRTTMLSCPMILVNDRSVARMNPHRAGFSLPSTQEDTDVSFAGSNSSRMREEVVRQLSRSNLSFAGGLYGKGGQPLQWDGPAIPIQSPRVFHRLVRRTKVNLALEGIGEFTYRHLELWCLCAFMMSSPSLRDIRLPCGLVPRDGIHFTTYQSMDDLVDKCRFYLSHESDRKKIAQAGRSLFLELYDFRRHGLEISDALRGIG